MSQEAACRRSTVKRLLDDWASWAQNPALGLSDAQQQACYGPVCSAVICDRAEIGGIGFASARVQKKVAGKRCTVAISYEGADGSSVSICFCTSLRLLAVGPVL